MNQMSLNEFTDVFNIYFAAKLKGITDLPDLSDLLRYTPESGGKRLRAYLIYIFGNKLGIERDLLFDIGSAVEMFHSGSLIHDDLPALDNDDYRRGRLTLHKVFGEDKAILAGDHLMLYPARLLVYLPLEQERKEKILKYWLDNSLRVIEGEYLDIASPGHQELDRMKEIHLRKTAALFAFCFGVSFILAGEDDKVAKYDTIGKEFGLIFQQLDDIKDELLTIEELGKTPGKDAAQGKTTILRFMKTDEAVEYSDREFERILREIEYPGVRAAIGDLKDLMRRS